jgi:hypothetical protein
MTGKLGFFFNCIFINKLSFFSAFFADPPRNVLDAIDCRQLTSTVATVLLERCLFAFNCC